MVCAVFVCFLSLLRDASGLGVFFFFQAEDGIRDAQESRGLGDVYKRQVDRRYEAGRGGTIWYRAASRLRVFDRCVVRNVYRCLLYTSDAADDLLCVDLGGRRIIKKKNTTI